MSLILKFALALLVVAIAAVSGLVGQSLAVNDLTPGLIGPPIAPPVDDKITPVPVPKCQVAGCSGELCVKEGEGGASICLWKEEYACLKHANCEARSDGSCGWNYTDSYKSCMGEVGNSPTPSLISDPNPTPIVATTNTPTPVPATSTNNQAADIYYPSVTPIITPPTSINPPEAVSVLDYYISPTPTPSSVSLTPQPICGNNVCEWGEADQFHCPSCQGRSCLAPCFIKPGSCDQDCAFSTSHPPILTTAHLPGASIFKHYLATLTFQDADADDELKVRVDGLPWGISLKGCEIVSLDYYSSQTACNLSGRPVFPGHYTVQILAEDLQGNQLNTTLPLQVKSFIPWLE